MTADELDEGRWVTARVGPAGFRTEMSAGEHLFVADEPLGTGGTSAGPTPYEYLLAALSGCMAMTLRMYADRKQWPLESVEIRLRSDRSHKSDCTDCVSADVGVSRIERKVELGGPLTEEQRSRLLQIADRCPVKQTLTRGITITGA